MGDLRLQEELEEGQVEELGTEKVLERDSTRKEDGGCRSDDTWNAKEISDWEIEQSRGTDRTNLRAETSPKQLGRKNEKKETRQSLVVRVPLSLITPKLTLLNRLRKERSRSISSYHSADPEELPLETTHSKRNPGRHRLSNSKIVLSRNDLHSDRRNHRFHRIEVSEVSQGDLDRSSVNGKVLGKQKSGRMVRSRRRNETKGSAGRRTSISNTLGSKSTTGGLGTDGITLGGESRGML